MRGKAQAVNMEEHWNRIVCRQLFQRDGGDMDTMLQSLPDCGRRLVGSRAFVDHLT